MKHPYLYDALSRIHSITENAWAAFEPLVEVEAMPKGDYLVAEGQRAHHCYMLLEGIVRVYFNKNGDEYNKTFFGPGSFPTAITALLTQSPAELNFQALTDCRLVRFSFAGFRALFDDHRCFESLFRIIMEREWINKERHDIRMVTNDATTNYLIFREEYPGLEQLIPQYHIASHLGITPIQLSRIRAKLLQEGN
ncbi:MAG: Crp/Fnr family transcriptional regulator [Saprospiraceae bacterium]|nr:Crp/Fnr family transcriptional regulator [Saprospiraceae bacterium]